MLLIFLLCSTISLSAAQNQLIPPTAIETCLNTYTAEEKTLINKDLSVVRSVCFGSQAPQEHKKYLATAGGPGARKSTTLEYYMKTTDSTTPYVYLDPDQRALKFMAHTYQALSLSSFETSKASNYLETIKNGYNKWRGASNYIAQTLLNEAFLGGYSIAFGTTSTGPHVETLFKTIKASGYELTLLLCGASDATRVEAIRHRNTDQRFYQSSPEDIADKGILFAERMDLYFKYADTLEIFWSDHHLAPITHAATIKNGVLTVINQSALDAFIKQYESHRSMLNLQGKNINPWQTLLPSKTTN